MYGHLVYFTVTKSVRKFSHRCWWVIIWSIQFLYNKPLLWLYIWFACVNSQHVLKLFSLVAVLCESGQCGSVCLFLRMLIITWFCRGMLCLFLSEHVSGSLQGVSKQDQYSSRFLRLCVPHIIGIPWMRRQLLKKNYPFWLFDDT